MIKTSKRTSYGHGIERIGPGHYRLRWTVDRRYAGSRLRFPTSTNRDTDIEGAERFAKKWGLTVPQPKTPA
jgi:hypothetical protein